MAGFDLVMSLFGKDVSASESLKKVGNQAEASHGQLGKLGGGFLSMGKLAAGAGVALGGIAFAKVAGEGLEMAATLEQSAAGFKTMLGSAEKSQAFVKQMADFASKTPFEFPELADSAQTMMAFGFNAKDVIPTMTKVGDAVGALGGTSETVDRVVMALGQMKAKGKVSGEEMLQLTEAGIPAWQLLADKIGVTVPEAQAAATKGQIDLDTAMTGIIDGMGKKYAGGMEAQAQTISGMMSTLTDNVGLALAGIITPLMPYIKQAIGAFSDFAGNAGPAVARVMEKLGPILGQVFGYLADAGKSILPKLQEYWGKLGQAFEDARPGLEKIAGVFLAIGKAIVDYVVPAALKIASWLIPKLVAGLGMVGEFLPKLAGFFLNMADVAVTAFAGLYRGVTAALGGILKVAAETIGRLPGFGWVKEASDGFESFRDKSLTALDKVKAGIDTAKTAVSEWDTKASQTKEAKLKADITDLDQKLVTAVRGLNDPELTKERKAEIKADIADLKAKKKEALEELEALPKSKEVALKVRMTVHADYKARQVSDGGGMGGNDDGSGLMSATAGKGHLGAGFGKWGPKWSWNKRNGLGQHDGADISVGMGTPVYATRSGRIVDTGTSGWAGNHVVWEANGTRFIYAHLSSIGKSSGSVGKGTYLGRVGRSGNATGPHLHVQASRDGHYVNPAAWLANGGIVTRPTLIGAGEAGPEAIIPLPRGGAGALGGDIHIHIEGGLDSAETIARRVRESLLDYKRRTGMASLGLA